MRFPFFPCLLLVFSALLHGGDEIPYFQVDMEGAPGAMLTRELSHWIFCLQEGPGKSVPRKKVELLNFT